MTPFSTGGPETSPPPRLRSRLLRSLFAVTLLLVFFPNLIWYPHGADNFDPSWQWSLSYAAANHLQWGRDYIFNYGPLGYLNQPDTYGRYDLWLESALVVLFAFAALFGAMAVALRSTAPGWIPFRHPGEILMALLVFDTVSFQLNPMWDINAAGYVLLSLSLFRRAPSWPMALGIAFLLALCALIKTTFLYGGASLCLGYLIVAGLQREPRRIAAAMVLFATFPLAYLLLFLVGAGQRPENFISFIQGSLQIVRGYSSMTLTGDPWQIGFALLLLALYLAALACGARRDRAYLGLLLLSGPLLFLNWKEAFMRHNRAHYANFFITMLLVFWLHSVLTPKKRFRNLYLAGALACFTFLTITKPIAFTIWRPEYGTHNLCQFLDRLGAGPSGLAAQREAISASLRASYQLPAALLQALRPVPTLIVPSELLLAPAYGLPLALPPVPQLCSAYTMQLDETNRRWLDRTQPPQVLFAYTAFDDRYPLFESPEVSAELLRRYRVVARAGNDAVLSRDPTPPPALVWSGRPQLHRFGEKIDLPAVAPQQSLWAKIWIQRSWPGEVLSFFFKSANPRITFQLSSGASASYPFVYETAPNGLLISPYVADLNDYLALHRGQLPPNVAALAFTLPPGDGWQYAPSLNIEFGRAP